ncbi:MAG TPA: magnesium transporter [Anaerolineaceae bacterium]|nr:magnesium transporter [Anaerolineaceae bacterium]
MNQMENHERRMDTTLERIRTALETDRVDDAVMILVHTHPADRAEIFNLLDENEQDLLLPRLDLSSIADLLEELEDNEAVEAVEDFTSSRLADVLDQMEPDEAADLLGDLPDDQVSEVLAEMEDADEVIPLLGYPDETAGGRMTTSYITLRPQMTVEQALVFLRQTHPDAETPYYLFVTNLNRVLVGVVGLRELVTALPETTIDHIMKTDVVSVQAGMDQEEAADVLRRYNLAAIPVVDEQHHLLGVITRDDVLEVLEAETTEDILHQSAVESGRLNDRPYWSQRISETARSRIIWLLTLFIAETLTGTILRQYEAELKSVISLAFFVPLLIGTGGIAGSQTMATVIRAITLKEIRAHDLPRVLAREAFTGLLLGLLVGVVAFGRAYLWGVGIQMAITVAVTIVLTCLWATTVASLLPLLANQLRIDPTVVSGPLMMTLIDVTGLALYFSLAVAILRL